jgi:hypothetical protein
MEDYRLKKSPNNRGSQPQQGLATGADCTQTAHLEDVRSPFAFSFVPFVVTYRKIIELLSTFDRIGKPIRLCATTCPGFT